jgi:hypothetical protein
MTKQHPITPPPELFAQWEDDILESRDNVDYVLDCAWRNGFQAGADQELEACCEWLDQNIGRWDLLAEIRAARRPKPPSLKEQALELLDKAEDPSWDINDFSIVRKALEQLDD